MILLFRIVVGALLVAYPLLVYWGLQTFDARRVAILLLVVVALRASLIRGARRDEARRLLPILGIAGALGLLVLLSNREEFLLMNPALMSLAFLGVFAVSLVRPPSMVERFARLQDPNLPPRGVAYCRGVTKVWCAFFGANAAAALWTVWHGDLQLWTLYNGLVSYLLMGALFGAEFLVRIRVKRSFARDEEVS